MKLPEIKDGQAIFIDANIFIYHFTGASKECKELLKACDQRRLSGFTSTTVLAEVCHRLMIIEAISSKLVKSTKQVSLYLQKHPALVKQLSEYYTQTTNIFSWSIQIIIPPQDIIIRSQIYRQRFSMFTNDSFIPIYMETAGITNLASADKIFCSIPHLNLFAPSDIHI